MKKLMCLAVAVLAAGIGFADTLTWTGGGASNNFNDPVNWGGKTPASGDTLSVTAAAGTVLTLVNDLEDGFQVAGLVFGSGGAVELSGNKLALTPSSEGYVWKSSCAVTNACPLELVSGDCKFYTGAARVRMDGVISGAGKLVKVGSKNHLSQITLTQANTYTGSTQIDAGIIEVLNDYALGSDTNQEVYVSLQCGSQSYDGMATLLVSTDNFYYPIRLAEGTSTSGWFGNTWAGSQVNTFRAKVKFWNRIYGGYFTFAAAGGGYEPKATIKDYAPAIGPHYFYGPVDVTGLKLYTGEKVHFYGAVTNRLANLAFPSYSFTAQPVFYNSANEFNGTIIPGSRAYVYAQADNVLNGAVLSPSNNDYSRYYLQGYDQVVDRVSGGAFSSTSTGTRMIDGGSGSATLTMKATADASATAIFINKMSIVYDPQGDFTYACISNRASTMTGTITVKGGTFRTEAGHTFKNVTNLVVTAGTLAIANTTVSAFSGVKAISLGAAACLDLTAAATPFSSSVIDADIAEGGKIALAADETALNLKSVVYANHGVGVGYYTGADGIEGAKKVDWIEGSGKLYVASSTVGVEPAGWQGPEGSEGTSVGTAANWDFAGALERMNDYSLIATFATAGTTATVDRAVNWAGIRFETPNADSFTLLKGNDGANVALGGRGIETALRSEAGVYRIEAPVTIAAPQTWKLGDKTTLDVAGGLMNADVPGVQSITRPMGGKLILRGNEASTYTGNLYLHGLVDAYGDDPFGPGAENGGRVYFYGGDNPAQNKDYITFYGDVTVTKPFTLYGNWQNNPIRFAGSSQTVTFEDEVSWGGRCLMGAACNIVFNGGGMVNNMPIYQTQGGTVGKIIFAGKPYTIDFESSETRFVHIHFNVASNKVNWIKGYYAQHIFFGVDWALYEGNTKVYLQNTASYGTSSLDLCGHSQRADYAAGNSLKCWFTNSAEAATMYMDGRTSITNLTEFRGPFNLSKAGASLYAMGSATTCVTNTSTGFLEVKGGTMVFRAGSSWAGTDVRIDASADANDAVLSLEDGNALARKAELTMTDGATKRAKLELAAGTVQKVRTLTINGQMLYGGTTYGSSQSDAAVKDDVHFSGTGVLYVSHPSGALLLIR